MKTFVPVVLLICFLSNSCKKESSANSNVVLNTFTKGSVYKIKKEVTFVGTDSVFVFNGDSLFPGIPFVIQFNDSAMLIANSCQTYLFNHFNTCNSLYHKAGNQLYIDEFSSLRYNKSACLFNIVAAGTDTILASSDGVYEMYLETKN